MALCTVLVVNNAPGCSNSISQQITGNCDNYIVRLSSNSNALGPFSVFLDGNLVESGVTRTDMFNGVVVVCGCPTPTPTPTITSTPTPTPTIASTATPTPTNTATPTVTGTPGASPTMTPTQTETPSLTPTQTLTPTVTGTPGASPTLTPTPTESETPTPTPTNTETPTNTPTVTPTNTETPTETPTQTPTPSISYVEFTLGYDSTVALTACSNFTSLPISVYGSPSGGPGPNIGETLYSDSGLTTTVPDGYYSNGTAWYQVSGGSGLITAADPNGCLVTPTPTPTVTGTSGATPTVTPTLTLTPTTSQVLEIYILMQNGNDFINQDGSNLIAQQLISP